MHIRTYIHRLVISLSMCLSCLMTHANDGVYMTSGNQLVPLQETDISVKKEVLTITLTDTNNAVIDVAYEFFNPSSRPKTVLMGFEADPSYNDDYELYTDGRHKRITQFTVTVNGQRLSYRNAVCNLGGQKPFSPLKISEWEYDGEYVGQLVNRRDKSRVIDRYAYVYYFEATFMPGINKIQHRYSYTKSGDVMTAYHVPYKLTPATRWANRQIDDFTLVIRADNTAKHFCINRSCLAGQPLSLSQGTGKIRPTRLYDEDYYEVSLRNGTVKMHATAYRPAAELSITSACRLYTNDDKCRFGYTYDRGSSLPLLVWKMYIYPQNQNAYTPAQLRRISRNLPYASRGHVFKDAWLKRYFTSLWWYMPDPSYSDDASSFTKVDREYVNAEF